MTWNTYIDEQTGDLVAETSNGVEVGRWKASQEYEVEDLKAASVNTDSLGIGDSSQVTGGPVGDEGETIILTTTTSAALDQAVTSTSFQTIAGIPERSIADYSDVLDTNIDTYEITHGIYELNLSGGGSGLEFRMDGAGAGAPGPITGNSAFTLNSTTYRETYTFEIDPDNWGKWTPLPELRSTDGNEVSASGVHTVILRAVIS